MGSMFLYIIIMLLLMVIVLPLIVPMNEVIAKAIYIDRKIMNY